MQYYGKEKVMLLMDHLFPLLENSLRKAMLCRYSMGRKILSKKQNLIILTTLMFFTVYLKKILI